MDEDDSLTLIDELEKSTLSVADESSVELDSSAKLEELSTARTSPELPKSPKASESATFSDSEQATNAITAKRHKKFFTNPPPKSRNQHLNKIYSNHLQVPRKNGAFRISVASGSFVREIAQIIEKCSFRGQNYIEKCSFGGQNYIEKCKKPRNFTKNAIFYVIESFLPTFLSFLPPFWVFSLHFCFMGREKLIVKNYMESPALISAVPYIKFSFGLVKVT